MSDPIQNDRTEKSSGEPTAAIERSVALRRLGRFAVATAPAVTLLLAAGTKSAKAQGCISPCSSSSRQFKIAGGAVDGGAVLGAVACLAVAGWWDDAGAHIAPDAGDFRAAFGLGDGVTVNPIDAIGVCLSAIKALSARLEALEAEVPERGRAA